MKKLLLLIALLLPALFVTAQGIKNGLKEEPKINVGIKGGFTGAQNTDILRSSLPQKHHRSSEGFLLRLFPPESGRIH